MISIIMIVYNEALNEINESINPIIHQTYKNFELIIVDDNPNNYDIKNNLDKWNKTNNKIKVIYHKKNLELIKSKNDGIKHDFGQITARIDADDISKKLEFICN